MLNVRPLNSLLCCAMILLSLMISSKAVEAADALNLARGKSYSLSKTPNYPLCTDKGDLTDLTDGKFSADGFWSQKSTVGWSHARKPVEITVDLGKVQPISGAMFSTAWGGASVTCPRSIAVLVSEDNHEFRLAGDLITLTSNRLQPAYGHSSRQKFSTMSLQARGRYVRFVIIATGAFLFCDEIAVFRSPASLLTDNQSYPVIATYKELADPLRLTQLGCQTRMRRDLETTQSLVQSSTLSTKQKNKLNNQLKSLSHRIRLEKYPEKLEGFRAIIPFNDLHRKIFQVRAQLLPQSDTDAVLLWHSSPYQLLGLFAQPEGNRIPKLSIAMMNGETRAEVLNLTNTSPEEITVGLSINGLSHKGISSDIKLFQIEAVDTREGRVVSSALTPLARNGNKYTTTIPSGITRQIWFSFQPKNRTAGDYTGHIDVQLKSTRKRVPVGLDISPFKFPERPELSLSMWDYAFNLNYNITKQNQKAAIQDMLEHYVDSPWSGSGGIPFPKPSDLDAQGNLVGNIDFSNWDAFVKMWPNARRYLTFATFNDKTGFAGNAQGTPEFERAISQWAAAWAKHNSKLGLKPGQACILFQDEPVGESWFRATYRFAKAMKMGTDEIFVFIDPHHSVFDTKYGREALAKCDILCPLRYHYDITSAAHRADYQRLRKQGKQLWFYMCTGPTRQFDPSYFRMQPWHCFEAGATGCGFWAYGDGGKADNWNEYPAIGAVSYTPVYLSENGVHSSKHWEAVREGVQDYQYLVMLRYHIERLEKQKSNAALLGEAKQMLAKLPGETLLQVRKEHGPNYFGTWSNASSQAESGRLAVLKMLSGLSELP